MEFLIIDSRLAYHGMLRRPALKDLEVVTSIHRLCIKFSTENEVKTVRGDQRGVRECYLSSIRKAESQDVNFIIDDMDMMEVLGEAVPEHEDVEMIDVPPDGKKYLYSTK